MSLTRLLLAALIAVPLGLMTTIPSASARDDYEARNQALHGYQPDTAQGQVMFRQCALCHGQHGQGIIGGKYPRIAGFPEYYLMNALRDYQTGQRGYDAMLVVGGLKTYDDRQLMDLSGYIAQLEIDLSVPIPEQGNARSGSRKYRNDCRTCHGRRAEGVSRKDSPPLRGQYYEYLLRQIALFRSGERIHGDDPDDDTFDIYDEGDVFDILAFVTSLDGEADSEGENE